MSVPRRTFLGQTLAGGVFASLDAGCTRREAPLQGSILGRHRAERGHRLWSPPGSRSGSPPTQAGIVVVGGGVAGLGACWRLMQLGKRDIVLLDLDDRLGGTAQAGVSEVAATHGQPFALGAHYLTLPNAENGPTRALLAELGVITGFDHSTGRPHYAPEHLCLAPQERLFVAGEWVEGLWPAKLASSDDHAQKRAWDDLVRTWTHRRGADGRPAFSIPVALASQDPAIRQLAGVSFADWLAAQGFTSEPLLWLLEYATRDDYGTTLAETSAWAGLHYHCARRSDPFDNRDLGTHVLTWPAGNGWLVERLRELVAPVVRFETGCVVRQVEAAEGRVHVERVADGSVFELVADHVIVAVPTPVANRLMGVDTAVTPTAAPWRVAVLHCDAPLASTGVPLAWDSVEYGASHLGYISNAHQHGSYGGPTVLTWYQPLAGAQAAGRADLLTAAWETESDLVMQALSPLHTDLRARVQHLDIWHWGHGTVRPTVGLHVDDRLAALSEPVGRVLRAHTDLSGLSLFEEALWHGVQAAETIARR